MNEIFLRLLEEKRELVNVLIKLKFELGETSYSYVSKCEAIIQKAVLSDRLARAEIQDRLIITKLMRKLVQQRSCPLRVIHQADHFPSANELLSFLKSARKAQALQDSTLELAARMISLGAFEAWASCGQHSAIYWNAPVSSMVLLLTMGVKTEEPHGGHDWHQFISIWNWKDSQKNRLFPLLLHAVLQSNGGCLDNPGDAVAVLNTIRQHGLRNHRGCQVLSCLLHLHHHLPLVFSSAYQHRLADICSIHPFHYHRNSEFFGDTLVKMIMGRCPALLTDDQLWTSFMCLAKSPMIRGPRALQLFQILVGHSSSIRLQDVCKDVATSHMLSDVLPTLLSEGGVDVCFETLYDYVNSCLLENSTWRFVESHVYLKSSSRKLLLCKFLKTKLQWAASLANSASPESTAQRTSVKEDEIVLAAETLMDSDMSAPSLEEQVCFDWTSAAIPGKGCLQKFLITIPDFVWSDCSLEDLQWVSLLDFFWRCPPIQKCSVFLWPPCMGLYGLFSDVPPIVNMMLHCWHESPAFVISTHELLMASEQTACNLPVFMVDPLLNDFVNEVKAAYDSTIEEQAGDLRPLFVSATALCGVLDDISSQFYSIREDVRCAHQAHEKSLCYYAHDQDGNTVPVDTARTFEFWRALQSCFPDSRVSSTFYKVAYCFHKGSIARTRQGWLDSLAPLHSIVEKEPVWLWNILCHTSCQHWAPLTYALNTVDTVASSIGVRWCQCSRSGELSDEQCAHLCNLSEQATACLTCQQPETKNFLSSFFSCHDGWRAASLNENLKRLIDVADRSAKFFAEVPSAQRTQLCHAVEVLVKVSYVEHLQHDFTSGWSSEEEQDVLQDDAFDLSWSSCKKQDVVWEWHSIFNAFDRIEMTETLVNALVNIDWENRCRTCNLARNSSQLQVLLRDVVQRLDKDINTSWPLAHFLLVDDACQIKRSQSHEEECQGDLASATEAKVLPHILDALLVALDDLQVKLVHAFDFSAICSWRWLKDVLIVCASQAHQFAHRGCYSCDHSGSLTSIIQCLQTCAKLASEICAMNFSSVRIPVNAITGIVTKLCAGHHFYDHENIQSVCALRSEGYCHAVVEVVLAAVLRVTAAVDADVHKQPSLPLVFTCSSEDIAKSQSTARMILWILDWQMKYAVHSLKEEGLSAYHGIEECALQLSAHEASGRFNDAAHFLEQWSEQLVAATAAPGVAPMCLYTTACLLQRIGPEGWGDYDLALAVLKVCTKHGGQMLTNFLSLVQTLDHMRKRMPTVPDCTLVWLEALLYASSGSDDPSGFFHFVTMLPPPTSSEPCILKDAFRGIRGALEFFQHPAAPNLFILARVTCSKDIIFDAHHNWEEKVAVSLKQVVLKFPEGSLNKFLSAADTCWRGHGMQVPQEFRLSVVFPFLQTAFSLGACVEELTSAFDDLCAALSLLRSRLSDVLPEKQYFGGHQRQQWWPFTFAICHAQRGVVATLFCQAKFVQMLLQWLDSATVLSGDSAQQYRTMCLLGAFSAFQKEMPLLSTSPECFQMLTTASSWCNDLFITSLRHGWENPLRIGWSSFLHVSCIGREVDTSALHLWKDCLLMLYSIESNITSSFIELCKNWGDMECLCSSSGLLKWLKEKILVLSPTTEVLRSLFMGLNNLRASAGMGFELELCLEALSSCPIHDKVEQHLVTIVDSWTELARISNRLQRAFPLEEDGCSLIEQVLHWSKNSNPDLRTLLLTQASAITALAHAAATVSNAKEHAMLLKLVQCITQPDLIGYCMNGIRELHSPTVEALVAIACVRARSGVNIYEKVLRGSVEKLQNSLVDAECAIALDDEMIVRAALAAAAEVGLASSDLLEEALLALFQTSEPALSRRMTLEVRALAAAAYLRISMYPDTLSLSSGITGLLQELIAKDPCLAEKQILPASAVACRLGSPLLQRSAFDRLVPLAKKRLYADSCDYTLILRLLRKMPELLASDNESQVGLAQCLRQLLQHPDCFVAGVVARAVASQMMHSANAQNICWLYGAWCAVAAEPWPKIKAGTTAVSEDATVLGFKLCQYAGTPHTKPFAGHALLQFAAGAQEVQDSPFWSRWRILLGLVDMLHPAQIHSIEKVVAEMLATDEAGHEDWDALDRAFPAPGALPVGGTNQQEGTHGISFLSADMSQQALAALRQIDRLQTSAFLDAMRAVVKHLRWAFSNNFDHARFLPFPFGLPSRVALFRGLANRDGLHLAERAVVDLLTQGCRSADLNHAPVSGCTWAKHGQVFTSPSLQKSKIFTGLPAEGALILMDACHFAEAQRTGHVRVEKEWSFNLVFDFGVPMRNIAAIFLPQRWRNDLSMLLEKCEAEQVQTEYTIGALRELSSRELQALRRSLVSKRKPVIENEGTSGGPVWDRLIFVDPGADVDALVAEQVARLGLKVASDHDMLKSTAALLGSCCLAAEVLQNLSRGEFPTQVREQDVIMEMPQDAQ